MFVKKQVFLFYIQSYEHVIYIVKQEFLLLKCYDVNEIKKW